MALSQYCLAEIGLKSECGFSRLSGFLTQGDGWLELLCDVPLDSVFESRAQARANFGSNFTASLRYFCAPRTLADVLLQFSGCKPGHAGRHRLPQGCRSVRR